MSTPKNKGSLNSCQNQEKAEVTWQLSGVCYLEWNPEQKTLLGTHEEDMNEVGALVNNNISILVHEL